MSLSHFRKPLECNIENTLSISLIEVEESKEPDEFFKALGGKKYYCSLIKGNKVSLKQTRGSIIL